MATETVKNEFWDPLPPEVAEWMGVADCRVRLADAAPPIEFPAQRSMGQRLKHLFRPG